MRLRPFRSTRPVLAALVASSAFVAMSAAAQSLKAEDSGSRTAALVARIAAVRSVPIGRDVGRPTAALAVIDSASMAGATGILVTPYRSPPADENPAGGFAIRLPGTGLDLTNGSFSIRRTNDGRYGKGVHFSVQLTY